MSSSEQTDNQVVSNENKALVPENRGCGCAAWLGLLILLAAAGAVVFILIVKPELEKRGVDLDTHWENVKEKASDATDVLQRTKERAADIARDGAEKIKNTVDELSDKTDAAADTAAAAADKAAESTKSAAETTRQAKDKAVEKVESWY